MSLQTSNSLQASTCNNTDIGSFRISTLHKVLPLRREKPYSAQSFSHCIITTLPYVNALLKSDRYKLHIFKVGSLISFDVCTPMKASPQGGEQPVTPESVVLRLCNPYSCALSPQTTTDLRRAIIDEFPFSRVQYKWNHTVCSFFV